MVAASQRRLYYPLRGFSESLNLSVAAALVVQRLFDVRIRQAENKKTHNHQHPLTLFPSQMCPEARGDLAAEEKQELRRRWYGLLASTPAQRKIYDRWLAHPPPPLPDLRRTEEQRKDTWVPAKILSRYDS